jgi:hypothetical protein
VTSCGDACPRTAGLAIPHRIGEGGEQTAAGSWTVKSGLRPTRGMKRLRSTAVISAGMRSYNLCCSELAPRLLVDSLTPHPGRPAPVPWQQRTGARRPRFDGRELGDRHRVGVRAERLASDALGVLRRLAPSVRDRSGNLEGTNPITTGDGWMAPAVYPRTSRGTQRHPASTDDGHEPR